MKSLIMVVLFFFASGCDFKENKPEVLLSQEQMVDLMIDIQLLEATYNSRMVRLDDRKPRMDRYYEEIFSKHQTTRAIFDSSYTFYEKDTEILAEIYEQTFEALEKMEAESEGKKNTP